MNETSRIQNSTRNMIYGFLSQFLVLLLNFIVRIFFIKILGETFLGVNGLFTNILSVLSLAEMGFGTAITYNLYKPLAEKDEDKLLSLMNFYKKIYQYIGIFVLCIGLCILPFLDSIIKGGGEIQNVSLIYVLFLLDSVSSYFFAHRRSILNADQKAYILSKYRYIFAFIKSVLQIFSIIVFKQFLLYLIIQIVCTFSENAFISYKVNQMYPFLQRKDGQPLNKDNVRSIQKDVYALVLSKISHVALNGTDNIIISAYTHINNVGILSNYTLISGSLTMIVSQVTSAITGSVGNFIASESNERHYELFKKLDFLYFMVYAFCFICMFTLYNPFISLFFGEKYTFATSIVLVFCLNYLIEGLLQSFWTFRTTMGLFVQGRYRPLFAATINIVVSIILAKQIGVLGVLLGTTFSRVLVNAWYDPYIIFKHGLKRSPRNYYFSYLLRISVVTIITLIINLIKSILFVNSYTIYSFVALMFITIILASLMLVISYANTEEFKYYFDLLKSAIGKVIKF